MGRCSTSVHWQAVSLITDNKVFYNRVPPMERGSYINSPHMSFIFTMNHKDYKEVPVVHVTKWKLFIAALGRAYSLINNVCNLWEGVGHTRQWESVLGQNLDTICDSNVDPSVWLAKLYSIGIIGDSSKPKGVAEERVKRYVDRLLL